MTVSDGHLSREQGIKVFISLSTLLTYVNHSDLIFLYFVSFSRRKCQLSRIAMYLNMKHSWTLYIFIPTLASICAPIAVIAVSNSFSGGHLHPVSLIHYCTISQITLQLLQFELSAFRPPTRVSVIILYLVWGAQSPTNCC